MDDRFRQEKPVRRRVRGVSPEPDPLQHREDRGSGPAADRRQDARGGQGARLSQRLFRDARRTGLSRPKSEEHTSELQSLMRISYAVFCLKKKKKTKQQHILTDNQ